VEVTRSGASARRKGIEFEQALARWFETITTRNTRPGLHDDAGDIVIPGWTVELKAWDATTWTVRKWWTEVADKARRHHTRPMLILKVPRSPLGTSLVIARLEDITPREVTET
jgi:hypothetical protein